MSNEQWRTCRCWHGFTELAESGANAMQCVASQLESRGRRTKNGYDYECSYIPVSCMTMHSTRTSLQIRVRQAVLRPSSVVRRML